MAPVALSSKELESYDVDYISRFEREQRQRGVMSEETITNLSNTMLERYLVRTQGSNEPPVFMASGRVSKLPSGTVPVEEWESWS